jgi:hypothetical protein
MAESTIVRKAGRGRAVTRGTANIFADLGFPDVLDPRVEIVAVVHLRRRPGYWRER